MSGKLPQFYSGSHISVILRKNQADTGTVIAYAQGLTINENMAHVPVNVLGHYSTISNEPVGYTADGSLQLTAYSSVASQKYAGANNPLLPAGANFQKGQGGYSGNVPMVNANFHPAYLMISETFDLVIRASGDYYKEQTSAVLAAQSALNAAVASGNPTSIAAAQFALQQAQTASTKILATLQDCRFTTMDFSFSPGSILTQNLSFVCHRVVYENTGLGAVQGVI